MSNAKQDVAQLLGKLPDDCSLEDIQYHLYVMEKVRSGLDDEMRNGGLSQDEAEVRLQKMALRVIFSSRHAAPA